MERGEGPAGARAWEGGGPGLRGCAARGRPPPAVASLRPGLAGQGQGLGAVAAPGGAAAGLMLCDRAAPPDNWLPPAGKGCGLVSPPGVCAGVCAAMGGVRTCGPGAPRLSLTATGCAGLRGALSEEGKRRAPWEG